MIRFERHWAMPNKETFRIPPIKQLLEEEITPGVWLDPFCGGTKLVLITNDINPQLEADFHTDALLFLRLFSGDSVDGCLFDPPYSVRQLSECYHNLGIAVTQETTRPNFWTNIKEEIARVIKPGGKCISFGWNSGGIGKKLRFELTRILLVPHGGIHNDTIITVEMKL